MRMLMVDQWLTFVGLTRFGFIVPLPHRKNQANSDNLICASQK